ncbi:MAG: PAS domain S-box protein [Bdellovibrionales bacterium]|nr:PAS domain S-box protein [Bdellovibrionales bacterium]
MMHCSDSRNLERELRSMIPRLLAVVPGFFLGLMAIYTGLPDGSALWTNPVMAMGLTMILGSMLGFSWYLGIRCREFLRGIPGRAEQQEMNRVLLGISLFALLAALGWMTFSWGALSLAGPDGHHLRLVTYVVLSGVGMVAGSALGVRCWLLIGYMTPVMLLPPVWDRWVVGAQTGKLAYLYGVYLVYLLVVSRKSHEVTAGATAASAEALERAGYYRSVIESVPGIVTILDEGLQYTMANQHLTSFFGISERKIVGRPLGFLREDDFTAMLRSFFQSGLTSLQGRCQIEGKRQKKWFLVSLSRMQGGAILAVSFDIQAQVEAEQGEIDQRAKSEAAARLAAVGEMAAGVAHEINNPLAVILSNAEHVAESHLADANIQKRIQKIVDMVFRITRIAKSMKSLARDGSEDVFTPVRVSEIFDDVAAIFEERMKMAGVLFVRRSEPDHHVFGKGPLLSQLLLNLVGNAFDAVQGRAGAEIRLESRRDDGKIVIEVTDNGPGVPDAIRHKIMTPFFTTKPPGKGTGLGLSISQRIAQEHKGSLSLTDRKDCTTFRLELPKAASLADPGN